ncbi:MAG: hypothetical protein DRQ49_05200 [Gammaproteobacteria bacterium]|nr:MAG: hypothetical protein DRQ41_08700 [Gammaproteobacteria bacterium]RKZ41406.1 MAG: hypothetical protein DRQ49_05200 [Gammaproteobacteria bacterium]RKZ74751.1 MAG: hypothetical protein DRQ57_09955 [Gammaproteobacteria bacterium]
MTKPLFIIIAIFILFSCVVNPDNGTLLDWQYFKEKVTVNDHASNAIVTFSTIKGFQKKHRSLQIVVDDSFLRGFIDKRTMAKTYQVYNIIYYTGSKSASKWKYYRQANYQTPYGNKFIPVNLIKKEVDCSALPIYGKCLYSEHVTFEIDRALLKTIANTYTPRIPTESVWQYKLIPKWGKNYESELFTAEVIGLLDKMDKYAIPIITEQPSGTAKIISGKLSDSLLKQEPLIKSPSASFVLSNIK